MQGLVNACKVGCVFSYSSWPMHTHTHSLTRSLTHTLIPVTGVGRQPESSARGRWPGPSSTTPFCITINRGRRRRRRRRRRRTAFHNSFISIVFIVISCRSNSSSSNNSDNIVISWSGQVGRQETEPQQQSADGR